MPKPTAFGPASPPEAGSCPRVMNGHATYGPGTDLPAGGVIYFRFLDHVATAASGPASTAAAAARQPTRQ